MKSNWEEINKILANSGMINEPLKRVGNSSITLFRYQIWGMGIIPIRYGSIPVLINNKYHKTTSDKIEIIIYKKVFDGLVEFEYNDTKVNVYDFYTLLKTLFDKKESELDSIEAYELFDNAAIIIYDISDTTIDIQIIRWLSK